MSRIQQILEKAERDGTAQRVEPLPFAPPPSAAIALEPPIERQPSPIERRIPKDFVAKHTVAAQEPFVPVSDETTPSEHPVAGATLDRLLVAGLEPLSAAAEQYRSLRARISQAEQGQQAIRVIQVTSPGKQDGKTVTSLNLALTLAQEFQRRVLVIDADLRQPRVHSLLGLDSGPGLVDVVTGSCSLDEAIVEIPEYRLSVLRAGRSHERPAELLGSAAVRRVLDTLRTSFDRIVVDSAPAIVADPGALVPLVDRVLLVVRAGQTTKPSIAAAVSALGSSKLLGMVFNESRASQPRQYGASA